MNAADASTHYDPYSEAVERTRRIMARRRLNDTIIAGIGKMIRIVGLSLLCSHLNMPWWEALITGGFLYLGFSDIFTYGCTPDGTPDRFLTGLFSSKGERDNLPKPIPPERC